MIKRKIILGRRSFTLIELMITIVVGLLVLGGVSLSIFNSLVLNEYNEKFTTAMNFARKQLEQTIAKKSSFSTIISVLDTTCTSSSTANTLAAAGLDGNYRIEVNPVPVTGSVSAEIVDVRVVVCWKMRGGRIIGECTLDSNLIPPPSSTCGQLKFNDINGNSKYDSPCTLETAVAQN